MSSQAEGTHGEMTSPTATQPRATPVYHVPLHQVRPNPKNPRRVKTDLTGLAASIKQFGVLKPVLATSSDGRTFTLIAGDRRLAASHLAGRDTIPVIMSKGADAGTTMAKALVENIHHEPMAPMDEAQACQEMIEDGYELEEIARMLGRSEAWVTGRLDLLRLPAEAQQQVRSGALPLGPAKQLARTLRTSRTGSVITNARAPKAFTRTHPQAAPAKQLCDAGGHPQPGRLGPACHGCWEAAIRADERQTVLAGQNQPVAAAVREPALV